MIMRDKYLIFDLDDTLSDEIDFLKSAYREIANILAPEAPQPLFEDMLSRYTKGENVFESLVRRYPDSSVSGLLEFYRRHFPDIRLNPDAEALLNFCKQNHFKRGIITDGRSVSQRHKLKALGLESTFNRIIISGEFGSKKPDKSNFKVFEDEGFYDFYYIGDNPKKDFISPNKLGWTTICLLDRGQNIHQQNFDLPKAYLPDYRVDNLRQVIDLL